MLAITHGLATGVRSNAEARNIFNTITLGIRRMRSLFTVSNSGLLL
ncbi:MAG: hypothetical protein QNJ32_29455 [Xenococcaceae cyanobacterium MO_167.B27]|nr:hypothetical protein [Xenococcaceae cyanobacterium MO_167.B27]